MKDGLTHRVMVDGLEKDVVYSISGGGDEIWLGREHGGLTRLTGPTGSGNLLIARTWTQAQGLAQTVLIRSIATATALCGLPP